MSRLDRDHPLPDLSSVGPASVYETEPTLFTGCHKSAAVMAFCGNIERYSPVYDYLAEAQARFNQINYLYLQACEYIAESAELYNIRNHPFVAYPYYLPEMRSKLSLREEQILKRAMTYAESLYFFAWRIVDITREINRSTVGVTKISDEPRGIRDVRNHLIVHSEKLNPSLRTISVALKTSKPYDLVLRYKRYDGEDQTIFDRGFKVNCEEFRLFWVDWWERTWHRLVTTRS